MPPIPPHLEPVTPDPRKLRLTAFVLVVIMILGGTLILWSYQRYTAKQATNNRSAMNSNRLTPEKDLRVVRQDGTQASLFEEGGKIRIIQTYSVGHPESSSRTNEVMKRLATRYASQADIVLVSLLVDPGPAGKAVSNLSAAADQIGAKLPQWWVASNEPRETHKWLKKELRAGLFPTYTAGTWVFDTSIVVVDRNRIIRQPVVHQQRGGQPYVGPFDFDQAAGWDAKGVKTGTERTNVEELELLLIKTIDELLAEPVKPS